MRDNLGVRELAPALEKRRRAAPLQTNARRSPSPLAPACGSHLDPRDRIILALDVPNLREALAWVKRLRGKVAAFKIGSQLFTAEGPRAVERVVALGERVFLDLKFHDIPNTVAGACWAASEMGVWMLTVHAAGGQRMMEAAREAVEKAGRGGRRTRVVGVTVLTSLERKDLAGTGMPVSPQELALRLARLAFRSGLDGVVCSLAEIGAIRRALFGPGERRVAKRDFCFVVPGIRLAPPSAGPAIITMDDQRRVATAAAAVRAGADFLVIGRPILEATDPLAAIRRIAGES